MKTVLILCGASFAVLLGVAPAAAQPVKIRTEKDFPEGLKEFAGPLGALDTLKALAANWPEGDIGAKFNKPGRQNIHRYEWLAAKRRYIEYYDKLARQAAEHEKQFRMLYANSTHPQKDFYASE